MEEKFQCAYTELVDIDTLVENPKNNNHHPEKQIEMLAKIIKFQGQRSPIVVSNRSGFIVKGHGRLQALKKLGYTKVAVDYQDYENEAQEYADMIADNKIAELAEFDKDMFMAEFPNLGLDDVELFGMVEFPEIELQEEDEYKDGKSNSLQEKFLIPPFSIFNTRSGYWQDRKRQWIAKGLKSEVGRDANLLRFSEKVNTINNGTSIFDPVLCEIAYSWFSKEEDKIIDPFAGGSVRGIVASQLNRNYTGIDLRQEQIEANKENARELNIENQPNWLIGDSNKVLDTLEDNSFDMCLSCPPYADLEVYSDNADDLSNMEYDKFIDIYSSIISKLYTKLKDNSFVVWVIGEVRGKDGNYYNFLGDTITAFKKAGFNYYNEIILENTIGTAKLRVNRIFKSSRKVVKVHQNILVFVKGDGMAATKRLGDVEIIDPENFLEKNE